MCKIFTVFKVTITISDIKKLKSRDIPMVHKLVHQLKRGPCIRHYGRLVHHWQLCSPLVMPPAMAYHSGKHTQYYQCQDNSHYQKNIQCPSMGMVMGYMIVVMIHTFINIFTTRKTLYEMDIKCN